MRVHRNPFLTIYTTCRSFENEEFNIIQRNALQSWIKLNPRPQIIVLGDDYGVSEACREFKIWHIPKIDLSPTKAPILNKMMETAEKIAKYPNLLLISSDIILFQDTIKATEILSSKLKSYCASLLKEDILNSRPIDFSNPNWDISLKEKPRHSGGWGGDYYLYSKGFWNRQVPPFSIGRTYCDNWLYYYAQKKRGLVDLGRFSLIIHQKHGYHHVGGKSVATNGEESIKNKELAGDAVKDKANTVTIAWANWEMTKEGKIKSRYLTKCEVDKKGNRIYEFNYGNNL